MTDPTDPVSQAFAWYAAAAYAKDADSFASIYTDDIHVFDMWNRWELRGIDAWQAMAENWFGSLGEERVVIKFTDVSSTVGADLALGHATVTYSAVTADGSVLRSLDNRMTVGLRKVGNLWKIFHEHTSGPLEHQTLKGKIKRDGA
jgi:ketosteroid isomerase-like protein